MMVYQKNFLTLLVLFLKLPFLIYIPVTEHQMTTMKLTFNLSSQIFKPFFQNRPEWSHLNIVSVKINEKYDMFDV